MESSRRPWLQFSLRSLLLAMLVTAAFFGGRMSLQDELNRLRLIELENRRALEAARAAERAVLHQMLVDQVQAGLRTSAQNDLSRGDRAQTGLPLPKILVEDIGRRASDAP
jgi:hypothetical protein